ncbi:disease resistance protein At4g27190-like isoform X3 [Diospyros lotus]|nr:disease resistance protein At4g27190-like isoform X3 [Diospyros lotus]
MIMHVVIVQSSSKFAVDSGLLHVEKGRDPEVKLSTDKKVCGKVEKQKKERLALPRMRFVDREFGMATYGSLIGLSMNALQGQKLSAAEKQIVENMIGKCSDLYEEEKLKEIMWLEGNEGVGLSFISRHETEALKKLRKKAWELKRKFDLLVMFLYPMKKNATEESLAFTVGKFPITNDLIRRIKASILTKNQPGLIKEKTIFDWPDLSRTESPWDLPVLSPTQLIFKIWKQQLCEVEKDVDKYDFDIATYLPRDMVENMKDPPGIDMNYSTSSTKPAELTISSTSTESANATRTYEEEITVSQHEIHKFTVNSAVQQVVKYFEARRNGKIGISGSGWEEVTKALKDLPKIRNMFDIVQNVSLSNYESIMQLQQNVEEVQGPSSVHSSLGRPSRILLLVDYIDQRIDVDDLEFFDFSDSVCIVLNTRPENVNEILALNLEIRLEDCLLPWNLFCNNVGRVLVDSYDLQQKAMRLVEECHGNLIAIILLARILKGTKDCSVWELALHELMCQQSSLFLQGSGVILINVLRFAWERMSTDATKQNCIRYCLLQNRNKIVREALIYQGVRSGWIETVNKGEDVLKELTSSFLLENIGEFNFLMRAEIRLALMNILVVGKLPSYLDHGDIGPTKTLEMMKWVDKERNQMNSKLSELPECPYCPSLEKLSLQQNYDLMVIPSSFFLCMPALKVLNLSYTSIKCLPESISKLVNLEELFLRGCDLLMELPIEIGELEKLELFDLEGTPLSYLPEEIGKIDQLRSLKVTLNVRANLIRKSKDVSRIVPMKYLLERTQFKELSIDVHPDGNWWDIEVTSILSELPSFKCLNTLKLYLPNVEALKHIRWYGTTLIHPALECFRIIVGHYCFLSRIPHELEVEFNNLEKFEKGLKYMNGEGIMPEISKLLKRVSAVALERHWILKNLSELGLRNLSNLKFCCLAECNELQTIIDSEQISPVDLEEDDSDESESESECEEESVLSSLQYLSIHYMKKLESICRGRVSKTCLSSLKSMALHTCLSLTTIFTKEILDNLKNLKELIVEDCPKLSSLVSPECSNSTSDEYLPSLKKISLLELPELVNISNGLCIAPRLESMIIFYCPKLNKLSSTDVSSRNLDVFKGEEEWWNALEWNEQDTGHKYYLAGKFTPLSRDMDLMADWEKIRLTTTL